MGLIGSSPRVRGTPAAQLGVGVDDRFIPACAGNSSRTSSRPQSPTVHPRVCGELLYQPRLDLRPDGSSPRVRGTRRRSPRRCAGIRFIPACAGNSPNRSNRTTGESVHPRVCGELNHDVAGLGRRAGSSPRVRGTPGQLAKQGGHTRFIPACAGNSSALCDREPASAGSSPRVRGTLKENVVREEHLRFIPACAGNSEVVAHPWSHPPVHPRVCGEL